MIYLDSNMYNTLPSAVEGMDYTLEGDFQIVFESSVIDGSSNSSTGCAQINLTADNLLEESEFFTVMVTSVTPANVNGDVSQSTLVQIDDSDGEHAAVATLITHEHILTNFKLKLTFDTLVHQSVPSLS